MTLIASISFFLTFSLRDWRPGHCTMSPHLLSIYESWCGFTDGSCIEGICTICVIWGPLKNVRNTPSDRRMIQLVSRDIGTMKEDSITNINKIYVTSSGNARRHNVPPQPL
ncbi:hypothetical protein EDB19DRAFT_1743533, partial [Suillus lakei]